jgi:transposase
MGTTYKDVAGAGCDVHYKFSKVTLRDTSGRVVARERLDHSDRDAVRARLRGWPAGTEVVLESSFGWGWLSDEMLAAGLRPRLANCFKVATMRKARGQVKTNTKDADLLSGLLQEAEPWWEVWWAPAAVRDRREQMRQRGRLVRLQGQLKNQIHSVFHRHGLFHEFSDLFGSRGRVFLEALCQDGHVHLPSSGQEVLGSLVRTLHAVREELATILKALRHRAERTGVARWLKSIPGIGVILSQVLEAEIGKIERFRGHRKLASYALLAPQSRDSGEAKPGQSPPGRHLGQRGNHTLKWAFIEAAHGAVRSGGRWRAMFDRVTNNGKKDRNRGYINVARELVKVVYAVWKRGQPYTEKRPARPGARATSAPAVTLRGRAMAEAFFGVSADPSARETEPAAPTARTRTLRKARSDDTAS